VTGVRSAAEDGPIGELTPEPRAALGDVAALWLVRHGQSEGNVVRTRAGELAEELDIPLRDMDVPLSELGQRQAKALGEWVEQQPSEQRPEVVISSPYLRALDTARAIYPGGDAQDVATDERLRERDLGMMDLLTIRGFTARFPEESAHRKRIGKFYYRPPGGESWTDVALRARSLYDSISRRHAGRRVVLVTHEVVIIMFRYFLEGLDEDAAVALSSDGAIANCSLTAYTLDSAGTLRPDVVSWTAPLEEADVPVTESSDARSASR
jgi:2,3-bisphosphoglycerate-dependent phosphoglycerate mutase